MWLINYVTKNSISNPQGEKGNIRSCIDGKVQINASSQFKELPIVSPYGIAYVPPAGCQSVVIPISNGEMCVGTVDEKSTNLKPGEIMLYSSGGAKLELKNDGYVYINGVKFTADGH